MELMQESKGHSDKEEEEEEEITKEQRLLHRDGSLNFNSSSSSSARLDLMDQFHLGTKDDTIGGDSTSTFHQGTSSTTTDCVEKEHMFDKVVTPSDVGKLNRLVIPKQHAEKYFPLDSSTNDKGLLLNFEDRNGKSWRFRYSYWNSSQSYVMTKGWSRFVKEKKLDAGDIVSFQRGLADMYKHRLYIDWRRRPDTHIPDPARFVTPSLAIPSQYSPPVRWSGRLYSLPSSSMPNYQYQYHYHHHPTSNSGYNYNAVNPGSGSLYYLRSRGITAPSHHQYQNAVVALAPDHREEDMVIGGNIGNAPVVFDSVPVSHYHVEPSTSATASNNTTSKRLRLFGVNMEYSPDINSGSTITTNTTAAAAAIANVSTPHYHQYHFFSSSSSSSSYSSSSSSAYSHMNSALPQESARVLSHTQSFDQARFRHERGETSLPFDLDPSVHYFH